MSTVPSGTIRPAAGRPPPGSRLELLVRLLGSSSDEIVVQSIKDLRAMGTAARPVAGVLEALFDDERQLLHVRLAALFALPDIQGLAEIRADLRNELRVLWMSVGLHSEPASRRPLVYTPAILAFYDQFVLGFSLRYIWKCPAALLAALYSRHLSAAHLDCGVGTGYFLATASSLQPDASLTLVDISPASLSWAADGLVRQRPELIRADVCDPLPFRPGSFASVGGSLLLHCVDLPSAGKSELLVRLLGLLRPGGVLFGATVLGQDAVHGWLARLLVDAYNHKGYFTNRDDSVDTVFAGLRACSAQLEVEVVGSMALFVARPAPRRSRV